MTDPMGKSESYVYDNAGNMIQKTDRNGTVLKYDYDAMNRIIKEYAKVGASEVIKSTYAYDARNNLIEMRNNDSAIETRYNNDNCLVRTYAYQNGERYDIYYTYNGRGEIWERSIYKYMGEYQMSKSFLNYSYTYDDNGNITKIGYNSFINSSRYNDLVSYTYDSSDRITKETRGNITTDYTYNMAGLVTGMTNKNGSSVISSYSNTYNYDGNVAKAVENGVTKEYTYDYMNRLVYEKNNNAKYTYEYDEAGNRIKLDCKENTYEDYYTLYTYDKNNRLVREDKTVEVNDDRFITDYKYDNNGNQLTKNQGVIDLTSMERTPKLGIKTESELQAGVKNEYFKYDVFNQLKEYRNTEGTKATYSYMPNGYRKSKAVNGSVTNFLWEGDHVAVELDKDGEAERLCFRGINNLIMDNSGNNYVYDIHGSVTSIVNSGGTKSKEYEYNAFGKKESETNKSTENPWQYCGEYYDSDSGLIYLRNRYYDCETGSFINEDPARSGINWYSYCSGNPVMFVDPLGLKGVMGDILLKRMVEVQRHHMIKKDILQV